MEKFREQYPGVGLDIESERPEILHRQLMENELDVILQFDMIWNAVAWMETMLLLSKIHR